MTGRANEPFIAPIVACRSHEKLEEAAAKLRGHGEHALSVAADITDEGEVAQAFRQASRRLGRLDILVNNVGLHHYSVRGPHGLARWNETLDVNLTGAILCCRRALKYMDGRGGVIINIGSTAGKRGVPFSAPYVVSKWGLIGLTQTLAMEVGRQNIRVTASPPAPSRGNAPSVTPGERRSGMECRWKKP